MIVTPGDERHMQRALRLARTALEAGELPIAAVLADHDQLLAEAGNAVAGDKNLLAHAEFRTLTQFSDKMRGMKIAERKELCLYTTLEPCMMCFGMIMTLNIGKLIYALESPGDGVMPIVDSWQRKSDQLPQYRVPETFRGLFRDDSRALFREFATLHPTSRFARWARHLAAVTDL